MDEEKRLLDGCELPRISTGNFGLDDILGAAFDLWKLLLPGRVPRPSRSLDGDTHHLRSCGLKHCSAGHGDR
ncbi:hypothetical protein, partial [Bradyrhizobium ottawaense]|uniref:hypothetical protein n=1 Tax=Bradyrhizobium ottawaense TaxID=931866 RepID=UPI0030C6D30A